MKYRIFPPLLGLCSLLVFANWWLNAPAAESPTRAVLYDESADGAKQIAAALVVAKQEHKHVLLQFGANWCGWCHRLHHLFDTNPDIAAKLKSSYVVVLLDVNGEHNQDIDAKYGNPVQYGLPALVVLNADGRQLTIQDTEQLEEGDHHNPEKVKAFLDRWAPKK
ncbi:thioredoxin family protein [Prosthecobacter sp.]|uniref:thioredoxin family protein n=1 Tax=Prosthecobacter sp. TaxID=1965333 RepID=UPI001DFBCEC1|nr:thioredoxin family protein [Prosthecobacter sp.]MCB1279755.1 thioredoxin family protein [Prosthecobacter sp.]